MDGLTAMELAKRTQPVNITWEFVTLPTGHPFIYQIDDLACSRSSNECWTFRINNRSAGVGIGLWQVLLQPGDEIEWVFCKPGKTCPNL